MPVAATQTNGETNQAIGSLARILYGNEATWGTHPSAASKALRLLGGESLDQNLAVYRSRQIRPDRMHNAPVLGSMDPGGSMPFELAPEGWNWALYHLLLPSAVTSSGPSAGVPEPSAAPTLIQSALTGGIPAGTYYYVITAYNATGETMPSPVSALVTVSSPSQVTATFGTPPAGAAGVNLYRGTSASGPFFFAGTVAGGGASTVIDTNSYNGGAAPTENTTGQAYNYSVRAGTTGTPLPIGFSLEKAFTDVGVYELFTGCKIDKMRIDFRPDAIPSGTFDIIGQKFTSGTSGNFTNSTVNTPQVSNIDPYTGAYITLYESAADTAPVGSLVPTGNTPLGLCNDLTLNVDNAMYRRNGFIIGSQYRQNLKPGTRSITFTGRFMFQDLTLYNKAINATNTSIKIVCQSANGFWAHVFDLPTVRLTPNGSTPKITNDGPLEIQLTGQALPDESIGTDMQLTMVVPTPTIS